jgi:FkbM family methyltransferase
MNALKYIKKIASGYKAKYLGGDFKVIKATLMGKELMVHAGTVRKKADKDDAWVYQLCLHHDTIYDVGANVGYTSILAALPDPAKKIVMVDPNPLALSYASGNMIRNNLSINKMFILSFVGEKSGEKVKFYSIGTGAAGSMFKSHAHTAGSSNSYYWVNTTTVDEVIGKTGIIPTLIKIDVEGAESFVLKGATKIAAMQKTKFFIEMHASQEMSMLKNADLIAGWCKENHYVPYYLANHCIMSTPDMIAHRGKCHLLLIPANTPYPEYLKNMPENSALPDKI